MATFLPPPTTGNDPSGVVFRDWFYKLRDKLANLFFTDLNFTGSDITSIETRNHNDLQNIQGGQTDEYYHLTAEQITRVTQSFPVFFSSEGEDGDNGFIVPGSQGPQGVKGDIGPAGPSGGIVTIQGFDGEAGEDGQPGIPGPMGPMGETGDTGATGAQGPIGVTLFLDPDIPEDGFPGPQGIQGVQGNQGIQGIVGAHGIDGEEGLEGMQGPPGPIGPQGPAGVSAITSTIIMLDGIDGEEGMIGPPGIVGSTGSGGGLIFYNVLPSNITIVSDTSYIVVGTLDLNGFDIIVNGNLGFI